ncbi:DNA-binding transcriptional regulator, AcrR family [Amycolatopsis arida]|uniref:DNA-binding transcriptional regulator, AcrR family n=2 Tax=Amycolatopsis arida TaxID=587909 RepID=A0A1I5PTU6_9PSEU|nr:AcrR family transcriptional regulator [Amycolatopsis arida]SFP37399.1 DNA-binding transcriptional regulator, AcrR family [Amycolatopsis arida]
MGQDKASRILDAAESLLVGFGYRKVTVDEVARRAGVGKGTVYLYWPSKQELFAAVLTREAADLVIEHLAALRADPAEVRLHRSMRRSYLNVMRRPLARALYTGDHQLLGELASTSKIGVRFAAGKVENTVRYLDVLHDHGLLADDPAADPALPYRLSAAVVGAFHLEGTPAVGELDLADKADALATTLRRAFEPATEPAPAALEAAAAELADLYEEWWGELTEILPDGSTGASG